MGSEGLMGASSESRSRSRSDKSARQRQRHSVAWGGRREVIAPPPPAQGQGCLGGRRLRPRQPSRNKLPPIQRGVKREAAAALRPSGSNNAHAGMMSHQPFQASGARHTTGPPPSREQREETSPGRENLPQPGRQGAPMSGERDGTHSSVAASGEH